MAAGVCPSGLSRRVGITAGMRPVNAGLGRLVPVDVRKPGRIGLVDTDGIADARVLPKSICCPQPEFSARVADTCGFRRG